MDDFFEKHSQKFRVLNIISGIIVIAVGVLGFLSVTWDVILQVALPAYFVLFGLMILSAEFSNPFIRKYFSFLNSLVGRGFFNIYLATLTTTGNDLSGIKFIIFVNGVVLFITGVVYILMYCCSKKARTQAKEALKKEAIKALLEDN